MSINVALEAIERKTVECLLNIPMMLERKNYSSFSFFNGYRCVDDKLAMAQIKVMVDPRDILIMLDACDILIRLIIGES